MRSVYAAVTAVVLCLSGACSNEDPPVAMGGSDGGGGSGGGGAAVDSGGGGGAEADPESFFPMVDGASWSYSHSGGSVQWDEQVTLSTTTYEGEDAFLLEDTPGPSGVDSQDVLRRIDTAVLRVHKDEHMDGTLVASVDYDPGFARFDYAWVDEPVGYEQTLTYQRVAVDGQSVVLSDAPREHIFSVEAFDVRVDVPAGSFEDCMEIRRERVRAAGEVPLEGDLKRFWFCPGIGKTKEIDLVAGKIEELTRCDVPGGSCP